MANEIIIKIVKDSNGKPISLESMTIEAADALKVFIDSLTGVAKLHNSSEVRFSIRNGSVESVLTYPESEAEIDIDLEEAIEGKSYNGDFVKLLRNVQSKIRANGLSYEVIHKVKNREPSDLTEKFKEKDFTIRRGERQEWQEKVVFLSGRLYITGGKKNPNLHIDNKDGDYIIDCSEQQSQRLNRFLYAIIYVSAVKKWKNEASASYYFLDNYLDSVTFQRFKNFYESVSNDSLERFDLLHNKLVECVEKDNRQGASELIKLLRLFNHPVSDRGMLRTILTTLKPIKGLEGISELCSKLAGFLRAGSTNGII